jgi:hypothetical protein
MKKSLPHVRFAGGVLLLVAGLNQVRADEPFNVGRSFEAPGGGYTISGTGQVPDRPSGSFTQARAQQSPADLELADLRLFDAGDAEKQRGPAFRLLIRNAGAVAAGRFQVGLFASATEKPEGAGCPARCEVVEVKPGATVAADIRLPVEALTMTRSPDGRALPFPTLVVGLDLENRVPELNEKNNSVVVQRNQIRWMDTRLQKLEKKQALLGRGWVLRGEGLQRPGLMAALEVQGLKIAAEIVQREDSILRVKAPALLLTKPVAAQLRLFAPDGFQSEPLDVELAPRS